MSLVALAPYGTCGHSTESVQESVRATVETISRGSAIVCRELQHADESASRSKLVEASTGFKKKLEAMRRAAAVSVQNKTVQMEARLETKMAEQARQLADGGGALILGLREENRELHEKLEEAEARINADGETLKTTTKALKELEGAKAGLSWQMSRLRAEQENAKSDLADAFDRLMSVAPRRDDESGAVDGGGKDDVDVASLGGSLRGLVDQCAPHTYTHPTP